MKRKNRPRARADMWERCRSGQLGVCVHVCLFVRTRHDTHTIITAFPLLSSLSEVRAVASVVIMTL